MAKLGQNEINKSLIIECERHKTELKRIIETYATKHLKPYCDKHRVGYASVNGFFKMFHLDTNDYISIPARFHWLIDDHNDLLWLLSDYPAEADTNEIDLYNHNKRKKLTGSEAILSCWQTLHLR
jgi:hypothetical protein